MIMRLHSPPAAPPAIAPVLIRRVVLLKSPAAVGATLDDEEEEVEVELDGRRVLVSADVDVCLCEVDVLPEDAVDTVVEEEEEPVDAGTLATVVEGTVIGMTSVGVGVPTDAVSTVVTDAPPSLYAVAGPAESPSVGEGPVVDVVSEPVSTTVELVSLVSSIQGSKVIEEMLRHADLLTQDKSLSREY